MIKTDGDPHILTHPKLSSLQQWIIPFSVKLVKKSFKLTLIDPIIPESCIEIKI